MSLKKELQREMKETNTQEIFESISIYVYFFALIEFDLTNSTSDDHHRYDHKNVYHPNAASISSAL